MSCHVGNEVSEELHRRADHRGFYTRLLSPQGAYLQGKGLEVEEPEWLLTQDVCPPCTDLRSDGGHDNAGPHFPTTTHLELPAFSDEGSLYARFVKACWRVHRPLCAEFRLDFVEVYAGAATLSRSMLAEGFTVGPPIELDEWDMCTWLVFHLLVDLCRAGRISLLWLGPPCCTFSLARHPKLRSCSAPCGFDLLDSDTALGNLHMHQALFLFDCQCSADNEAVIETPWSAFSRKLPWWKQLAARRTEVRVDQCRYGTPYLKPTALLCTTPEFGQV